MVVSLLAVAKHAVNHALPEVDSDSTGEIDSLAGRC